MPSRKGKLSGKKGYGVKRSPPRRKSHPKKIELSFEGALQRAILNK